jgi:hypothetical protein
MSNRFRPAWLLVLAALSASALAKAKGRRGPAARRGGIGWTLSVLLSVLRKVTNSAYNLLVLAALSASALAKAPETVNIGYQKANIFALLKYPFDSRC